MKSSHIKVENVDKVYRIWAQPRSHLFASVLDKVSRLPVAPTVVRNHARNYRNSVCKEFFALRNINFEVNRGETVGIIGKNGSGKSTTLKIIAGTVQPTRGSATVDGRVAAMLELGSGFEHDFTGRENVFMSASILGLSREEINERFEDIVRFANIGDFLDQPVKTYSSGMMLRLAFAVHTAVEPEILIIDEALSVGDETFRRKCYARLDFLRERGTTILFVSHDLGSVMNLTDRALFFHQGEIVMEGPSKDVVMEYQRYCHVSKEEGNKIIENLKAGKPTDEVYDEHGSESEDAENEKETDQVDENKGSVFFDPEFVSQSRLDYATHGGEIFDMGLYDTNGRKVNLLQRRKTYCFEYKVRFDDDCEDVTFAMLIKTLQGQELGGSRPLPWDHFIRRIEGGQVYVLRFRFQALLMAGVYFINAGVEGLVEGKRAYIHRIIDAMAFRVIPEKDVLPTGIIDFLVEPEMELINDSGK